MSVLAKVSGEWRTVDCKENSGIYVRDAGEWVSLCPEIDVLSPFELITGYTIEHVGTSASLVGGQVEFEAVESLSLNNVFSSEYLNYVMVINNTNSTTASTLNARLRVSQTDSQSGYTTQYVSAKDGTVEGKRTSGTLAFIGSSQNVYPSAQQVYFYGPALKKPTAIRCVNEHGYAGGRIIDYASTHSLDTAYDGVTLYPTTPNMTGTLSVYGVRS